MEPAIYGPWEAGLTLIYEDPRLPEPQRFEQRRQVRVEASKGVDGGWLVRRSYSSLHQPPTELLVFHRGGGTAWVDPQSSQRLPVIPEGFPDRIHHWEVQGMRCRVLGRAQARLPLSLPAEQRLGVWVEARPPKGAAIRTFYLPGIGEAETLQQTERGWVCVNRLVDRGFTDAPPRPERGSRS